MKKLFIVLAAALISVSALAQVRIEGALSFGGYNKTDEFKSKAGFAGRVFYDFSIGTNPAGEDFFIAAGAGYMMNNVAVKNTSDGKFTCHWLQVPVMFGSYYPLGAGNLYGALGVYYAYGLSGKTSGSGVSLEVIHNETSAVNILKANDFGYIGQIGYVLPMGIGAYFGYEGGFINIASQPSSEAKNRLIEIGLLYKF